MGCLPGDICEEACDIGAKEGLWNELCSFSKLFVTSPMPQLILQLFRRFTYVTVHSPTLSLLHLHHSSFHNPSFASPTSQASSLTSPGEPPIWVCQKRVLKNWDLGSEDPISANSHVSDVESNIVLMCFLPGRACSTCRLWQIPTGLGQSHGVPSMVGHFPWVSYVCLIGQSLKGKLWGWWWNEGGHRW